MAPDGTLLESNQTALDFVRASRQDVVGRPLWESPWWAHSEGARDRLRRAVTEAAEGRFVRYEEDHHGPQGEAVTVDFSLKPVHNESGRVVLLIPEGRPISEQKKAAEALRLSEERFRGAFDAAAIGMGLVAPDGRWLQVNASLCQIAGYSEDELLGMTWKDITHPDDLDADLEHARRLLAGEIHAYQMEKRYIHKDGHIVWIVLSRSLVRDAGGEPLHFVAQIEDITPRKQAEQKLQDQTLLLELILEQMADAVVVADREGRFLIFNQAARKLHGLGPVEILPDNWSRRYGMFLPDGATVFPAEQLPLARTMRGESFDAVEVFIKNVETGAGAWVSVNGRPLCRPRRQPPGRDHHLPRRHVPPAHGAGATGERGTLQDGGGGPDGAGLPSPPGRHADLRERRLLPVLRQAARGLDGPTLATGGSPRGR